MSFWKGIQMNSFRLLEYKAKFGDHHIVDDLISITTKPCNWNTPPYSHSEIWWPNPYHSNIDLAWEEGECFTSTLRDEAKGTTIRPASQVLTHPDRWEYIELPADPIRLAAAIGLARLAVINNEGYDYLRLLGILTRLGFGTTGKDVCSEICERFMVWCGIFKKETKPSPRRLGRNVMRLGFKPLKLSGVKNAHCD